MNKKPDIRIIIMAPAGFVFRCLTAIICRAPQQGKRIWVLPDILHGHPATITPYEKIIATLFAVIPAKNYGLQNMPFLIGVPYVISSIGPSLAGNKFIIIFFQLLLGLGAGKSILSVPNNLWREQQQESKFIMR